MDVGFMPVGLAPLTTPEALKRSAQLAEELGFASLWASEHVVMVDGLRSTYPYSPDGVFPKEALKADFFDPLITLSYIAAHTKKIRLGTGIQILSLHNPLVVAKALASLDVLSEGRFDFGIGVGWQKEEFEALGVAWQRRGARTEEYVDVLKKLWQEENTSYEGEFCQFSNVHSYPKPVQRPHPPIIFGGESNLAMRRAARIGNGWYGMGISVETAEACAKKLSEYMKECGRKPDELYLSANPGMGATYSESDLVRLHKAGFKQVIVGLFAQDVSDVEKNMRQLHRQIVTPAGQLT